MFSTSLRATPPAEGCRAEALRAEADTLPVPRVLCRKCK